MQQFSFLFHNFCRVWQCTWSKQKLKQSLLPLCWSPLYIWIFKGNPIHHQQTFLCQIKDFSTLRKRYISHMRWHPQFPVYHRDGVKYRFYAKAHWWMTQDIIIREALLVLAISQYKPAGLKHKIRAGKKMSCSFVFMS